MSENNSRICHRCQIPIDKGGQFLRVGNYNFHKGHFNCLVCEEDLTGKKFWNKENDFFCKKHFEERFCPDCRGCQAKITSGRTVRALGFHYHPEHFTCTTCNQILDGKYLSLDQRPYCEEHGEQAENQPSCQVCHKPVPGNQLVKAKGDKSFHKHCLMCSHCQRPLVEIGGRVYRSEDKLYCERDYLILCSKSCTSCGDAILGDAVFVNKDEYYHKDCFKCSQCKKDLETYFTVAGELRCSDHTAATGTDTTCSVCSKYIPAHEVKPAVGKKFHADCLKCTFCNTKLEKSEAKLLEAKIACANCVLSKHGAPKQALGTPKQSDVKKIVKREMEEPNLEKKVAKKRMSVTAAEAFGSSMASNMLLKWKKGPMIGKGQFGKVFIGFLQNGQWIAVKQMEIKNSEDQLHVAQMEEEVRTMEKLRHENIVQLMGTENTGKYFNILMEYVPGKSLDILLNNFGPFPDVTIRWYVLQLTRALAYMHGHGLVHRDIKGKNILVDTNGNLKLADFGSAKQFENVMMKEAPSVSYNYTPLWTAPEVINSGSYDLKVDVWSLGCVMIEMTTAKLPWWECSFENPFRALFHIGNSSAIPSFPDNLSDLCKDFMLKCLTRDPEKRPTSMELLDHPFLQDSGAEIGDAQIQDLDEAAFAGEDISEVQYESG